MSEKRRYNGRRIFTNILWSLMVLAIVVLLGAAMSLKHNKHCKGVSIHISGIQNNFFIVTFLFNIFRNALLVHRKIQLRQGYTVIAGITIND